MEVADSGVLILCIGAADEPASGGSDNEGGESESELLLAPGVLGGGEAGKDAEGAE